MSTTTVKNNSGQTRNATDQEPQQGFPHRRLRKLGAILSRHIPTALVLASLVGIGAWGNISHWQVPKWSSLVGSAAAPKADWCIEHGVPESQCVSCMPGLVPPPPDYGWCTEHGVHSCPLHHPDVAQLKQSSIPNTLSADLDRARRALTMAERPMNNAICKMYRTRIQFSSLDAVEKAGVDIALVDRQPISEYVEGTGEVTYDQTRCADLSSRAAGTISYVAKTIGDQVSRGELLAVVDSVLVGEAKTGLVDALVHEKLQRNTLVRLQGLSEGIVAGRQVINAEAEYEAAGVRVLKAQQALANLGLSVDLDELRRLKNDEQMQRLRYLGVEDFISSAQIDAPVATANLLPIRAPMDGEIITRDVVAGEVVDTPDVLFQIADTSRMWLDVNVPLEDAAKLSLGQPVRFRPDGSPEEVHGALSWISTAADPTTRMVKVRAELPNPRRQLRDETFGTGRVILREEDSAIVVPSNAVHWEGCCHVVFVRDKDYFASPESPKLFHVRSVRVGAREGNRTEIIAGVLPGEVVASEGSDVLRAQLLKNGLGAGCCVVE